MKLSTIFFQNFFHDVFNDTLLVKKFSNLYNVLELNGNTISKNNIKIGHKIIFIEDDK